MPHPLTVTPEMTGDRPSMSRCTSRTASSLLLSLNRFLASSSSASWNCSKVMVLQDFPLWVTDKSSGHGPLGPTPYVYHPFLHSAATPTGHSQKSPATANSLEQLKEAYPLKTTVGSSEVSPQWEGRGKTREEDSLISSRDTLVCQEGPQAMVTKVGKTGRSHVTCLTENQKL